MLFILSLILITLGLAGTILMETAALQIVSVMVCVIGVILLILVKHSFFREVFLHTLKRMMPPHLSGSHCLLSFYSIMI